MAELAEANPLTANQLTAKTWENLVRRSCPFFTLSPDLWTGDSGRLWDLDIEEWVEARLAEEEVNVSLLAKILSKMEDRQTSLLVLLHVIAERFVPVIYAPEVEDYPMAFYLRCPCKKTHAVNHLGFLLLEKVEGSLESAEQEVVKVSLGEGALQEPWLSALASRLVRQRSSVAQIEAAEFWPWPEGGLALDNLLSLQQRCEKLSLTRLSLRNIGGLGTLDQDVWTKIAREVRLKDLRVRGVSASGSDLLKARRKDLRVLWDGLLVGEEGASFDTAWELQTFSSLLRFSWTSQEEKEEEWLLFETALDKPSAEWPEALKTRLL